MILTDMHVHTTFSADGDSPPEEMVSAARAAGVKYFGISEHFDYDYPPAGLVYSDGSPAHTDEDGYFSCMRAMQSRFNGKDFMLAAGAEFGYTDDPSALRRYEGVIRRYSPDFIINSVHTCDGYDCWFGEYFAGKSLALAYSRYLERVLESLSAPYDYDIVAHIGYVSRNAPYSDPKLRYGQFRELYDEILSGIISRGKILEVNSSSRGAGSAFLPDEDVLCRYFELGGRKVSFGSDAHYVSRICAGREEVVAALRRAGFTCVTVPFRGRETAVPV